MKFQSIVVLLLSSFAAAKLDTEEFNTFLEACADGKVDFVKEELEKNPSFAKEHSAEGESCLHIAGIHGEIEVTKALLAAGADPNLLTHMVDDPNAEPIQMHALSWHVFGGHLESAKLLLDHGADPNVLMDSIADEKERVTVLGMLEMLLQEESEASEEELRPFLEMRDLLKSRGAKRKDEL